MGAENQSLERGMVMNDITNNNQVLIRLTIAEAQQVLAIGMDEDAEEALVFVTEKLTKVVNRVFQPS
jgi:hypothetical protein